MGFFDDKEYDYTSVGQFIKEQEKNVIYRDGTALKVVGVGLSRPSQFGEQDILSVDLDGETKALAFSAEGSQERHRMLTDLQFYMEANPDENVYVQLAKEGRTWKLVDADSNQR